MTMVVMMIVIMATPTMKKKLPWQTHPCCQCLYLPACCWYQVAEEERRMETQMGRKNAPWSGILAYSASPPGPPVNALCAETAPARK